MRTLLLFFVVVGCRPVTQPPSIEPDQPASFSVKRSPAGLDLAAVEIDAPSGTLRFDVELAQTDPERQRGLMFREHLDDDQGMLFLFDDMRVQRFWMKNTKIPLDMIFIDDEGVIVGIVENAEPMTTTSRHIDRPSRYVLEVIGGTSRRLGIAAGQRVRFVGVKGHP